MSCLERLSTREAIVENGDDCGLFKSNWVLETLDCFVFALLVQFPQMREQLALGRMDRWEHPRQTAPTTGSRHDPGRVCARGWWMVDGGARVVQVARPSC